MADQAKAQNTLQQVMDLYDKRVMATYARTKVVFERGEGVYLWDADGRRWLDFLAGIAVNGVGHCHPRVVAAIREQASMLLHVSNLYYIRQQAELSDILCRLGGMDKAFICNSGAEANEAAMKIARKRGNAVREGKARIVAAEHSFHGRTLGTLAVTGQEKYQKPFRPLVPDVDIVDWDNIEALEKAVCDDTCAILLEPIQGEGGIRPASDAYLRKARELADKHGALLIFDEVQTGCGRTGTFFAYQGYGITPDIVTTAKTMGGGVPVGACLARGEAANVFQPGDHGTTFGGGPLICAAAKAAVQVIEEEHLMDNATKMGAVLRGRLEELGSKYGAKEVRGRGLMLAVVLDKPVAKDVLNAAFEEGLLVNAIGADVLRLVPPLIVNEGHIEEAIQKLGKAFERVTH